MYVPYLKSTDIERLYEEGRVIYIEGIAADTGRDITGDRASKKFIAKMASDMSGKPVYYNHNYKMPVIGQVVESRLLDDGNRLWVRAAVFTDNTDIRNSILNGALKFFSIGAVGTSVFHTVEEGRPTRVFDDGYAQEVSATGVPINPTAAYRVAKSMMDTNGNSDVDNNDSEVVDFIKSIANDFKDEFGNPINVMEQRNTWMSNLEETFMKGNMDGGAFINPEFWGGKGHVGNGMDNLNGTSAKPASNTGFTSAEGGQLSPVSIEGLAGVIQKAIERNPRDKDEFLIFVEHELRKSSVGYDHLNGTSAGQPNSQTSWGPGSEGAFQARQIAQEVAKLVRQDTAAPDYGIQPDDHAWWVSKLPANKVQMRGNDDPYKDVAAQRAGNWQPDAAGTGNNIGLDDVSQQFLASRGLAKLPPAARSEGFAKGAGALVRKAEDLLENPQFIEYIQCVPQEYLYKKGRGEKETTMQYIFRLLHERSTTDPNDIFEKAIDAAIVQQINATDFDHLTLEDQGRLLYVLRTYPLSENFAKCFDESIYSEFETPNTPAAPAKVTKAAEPTFEDADADAETDVEDEGTEDGEDTDEASVDVEKGSLPPWLDKKKKGKGKDGDKDSDDEDEDEDDDEKDDKKADVKKAATRAAIKDAVRNRIQQGQDKAEAEDYTKGFVGNNANAVAPKLHGNDAVEDHIFRTIFNQ